MIRNGATNAVSNGSDKTPNPCRFKFKTDLDKSVIIWNAERRGWQRTDGDDWNFFWANVNTIKNIFNPESGFRLSDGQIVNHFPNHYELTRKDLMVKNIKRYKKEEEKDISIADQLDFVPISYSLPADYSLFVEEFRRNPNLMWIMKPSGKAQGKGIFIVNKLSQLKKWANQRMPNNPIKDGYIVSRYIDNPLLIGQKKFDLRLYVLVVSYRPLKAYMYEEGFARFCNAKYSNDVGEMDNPFIHLTNVAVQKQNEDYNSKHGGKWTVHNLKLYVEGTRGRSAANTLFNSIDSIIMHSLKAVQQVMINDWHCFECYGYDIIIDDNLKAWLVEVNASPSLSTTTKEDRNMKNRVLRDLMEIVVPSNSELHQKKISQKVELSITNSFHLIIDESTEQAEKLKESQNRTSRANCVKWK